MPLDSEDTVFTPNAHHVYIFETIYNQRIIWYRWSNMVVVENEIYYVFSSDNLLESYAWSVHKKEDRAEHLLVKQTPLRYKIGRAGQMSIRGIRIDRDTGSFINTPYFASCARIKLPVRAGVLQAETGLYNRRRPIDLSGSRVATMGAKQIEQSYCKEIIIYGTVRAARIL